MSVLTFTEQASAPSTPSSGKAKLYVNTTPRLVLLDDAAAAAVYYPITKTTWTPVITGSTGDPTVTYTTQVGHYTTNGLVVQFHFLIQINTYSGGTGDARFSLPLTSLNTTGTGTFSAVRLDGVDLTGTPSTVVFRVTPGQAYGTLFTIADNGAVTTEPTSALAAGDIVAASGFYFLV